MAHPYLDLPRPLVIGHRGCAGEAPENTLLAFELGLEQGADILESDVHLTRDNVPVLIQSVRNAFSSTCARLAPSRVVMGSLNFESRVGDGAITVMD